MTMIMIMITIYGMQNYVYINMKVVKDMGQQMGCHSL